MDRENNPRIAAQRPEKTTGLHNGRSDEADFVRDVCERNKKKS